MFSDFKKRVYCHLQLANGCIKDKTQAGTQEIPDKYTEKPLHHESRQALGKGDRRNYDISRLRDIQDLAEKDLSVLI